MKNSHYYHLTNDAVLVNADVDIFPHEGVGEAIMNAILDGKDLVEAEYIEGYGLLDPRETDETDALQAHMENEYSNPDNWK